MNTNLKPIAVALIAASLTAMGTHALADPQERFIERKAEGGSSTTKSSIRSLRSNPSRSRPRRHRT